MFSSIRPFTLAAALAVGASPVGRAEIVQWAVDPALTTISAFALDQFIYYDVVGTGYLTRFRNQANPAPWSVGNVANFGGWVSTDYDESNGTIQIVDGGAILGFNSGAYRPNPSEFDGFSQSYTGATTAPAVFGGRVRAEVLSSIFLADAMFSLYNASLDVQSTVLSVVDSGGLGVGQFTVAGGVAHWDSLRLNIDGFNSFVGQIHPDRVMHDVSGAYGVVSGQGSISSSGAPSGFDRKMTLLLQINGELKMFGEQDTPPYIQFQTSLTAYANVAGPGSSPDNPIAPDEVASLFRVFTNVVGNQWFDFENATAFDLVAEEGSLLTGFTGLAADSDAAFLVSVDGIELGLFSASSPFVFAHYFDQLGDLLIDGVGVTAARLQRVAAMESFAAMRAFSLQEVEGLQIRVAFDSLYGSFSVSAVPEVGSLSVAAIGAVCLAAALGRARRSGRRR